MFKSIRWKFITIYFLLVFMAMLIVGVFIIQQFEEYHLNNVRDNLTRLVDNGLIKSIEAYEDLDESAKEIEVNIDTWAKGLHEEIFIVNKDFKIIASSTANDTNKNAFDVLDNTLLIDGINGKIGEADRIIKSRGIMAKNMVFPLKGNDGQIKGMLYLRANLSDIYKTLDKSKVILIQATLLALFITVFLGYFIARSITEPIMDVTIKAEKMAKGDFNQVVQVKSDDEIGMLAEMFNYLTEKLKMTMSEISSEKSKLETILDYMADGLIAVNNGGHIIHANPRAMEMLDLSEDLLENQVYDHIMENFNEKLTLAYIEENSSDWQGSQIISRQDAVLYANYAPFRDEKGEKSGIVMVLQDVTQRQKLENMRKEFVANVSHELKTPLTSIKSYTETLLEGALDDRQLSEDFLEVVNSEADRMARLVRDLLQLSSLDYKQVKWNNREADLVKIIKNSVLKMTMTAKNKNQQLTCISDEETMMGYMDSDKIEQVVLNIISNAMKYTPENGKIKVLLGRKENQGILRIIDNGMGIPKKDIPRLFERFYRVDKARSRSLGGTGLGLSIAKQIVEAHHGEIYVESEDGAGTEVVICVPLTDGV